MNTPIHTIKTDILFQFLIPATQYGATNIDTEFIQEAYIGYSYGSYYECGIAMAKDKFTAINGPEESKAS